MLTRSGSRALERAFGADIEVSGSAEPHLLPRPHLVLTDVHVHALDGSGDLDIPRLEATQSLHSLLSGRLAFSQLRLADPTASLDADRLTAGLHRPLLGLFGRALPARIVVTSGVVAVRSVRPIAAGLLTGLNAVVEGLDRNGAASLSGHATWRGQHVDVSAHLAPFFDFVAGRETAGDVKLRTAAVSAFVEGRLHAGIRGGFEGEVAVAASSLPDVLAGNGLPAAPGKLVDRVSFSGRGIANADNITFSNARLTLDDTALEGSLAWQPNEDHGAWTGTFATDRLDLTPMLALLPRARDGNAGWSDAPWHLDRSALGSVDLRVSANEARIGPVLIEDAAFSAICRDGRIEASLSEARSLDGLVRGRAIASLAPQGLDLKMDVSLSQMELAPLFGALGRERLSGTASGHFVGEAHGWSAKSLMASLSGRGQINVRQGSLSGLSIISGLAAGAPRWPTGSFDLFTADLDLRGDRIGIARGRLLGPGLQKAVTGEASLLSRSFSLLAADGGPPPAGAVAMNLAGTWDPELRLTRATAAAPGVGGAGP